MWDFELKFLMRQTLKQNFHNASNFDWKILQRVRFWIGKEKRVNFWIYKFYDASDIDEKKVF